MSATVNTTAAVYIVYIPCKIDVISVFVAGVPVGLYVKCTPIRFTDPLGLYSIDDVGNFKQLDDQSQKNIDSVIRAQTGGFVTKKQMYENIQLNGGDPYIYQSDKNPAVTFTRNGDTINVTAYVGFNTRQIDRERGDGESWANTTYIDEIIAGFNEWNETVDKYTLVVNIIEASKDAYFQDYINTIIIDGVGLGDCGAPLRGPIQLWTKSLFWGEHDSVAFRKAAKHELGHVFGVWPGLGGMNSNQKHIDGHPNIMNTSPNVFTITLPVIQQIIRANGL